MIPHQEYTERHGAHQQYTFKTLSHEEKGRERHSSVQPLEADEMDYPEAA
jgi:hypothetical protein